MTRIGELTRVVVLAVASVTLWDSYGCSLIVDAGSLGGGECPIGKKSCTEPGTGKDLCVLLTDPKYGCGSPVCIPCTTLLPGTKDTRCSNTNICERITCDLGFLDCNGNAQDGCEVNLKLGTSDPVTGTVRNCGVCTTSLTPSSLCQVPAGTGQPICLNGACDVACTSPYQNCNTVLSDGCETNTSTDPNNCGACSTPTQSHKCAVGQTCSGGVCK